MKSKALILTCLFVLAGCSNKQSQGNLTETLPEPSVIQNREMKDTNSDSSESAKMASESANTKINKSEVKMSDEVILKTSKGDIKLKLYVKEAPKTVENFLEKAESGYYEDLTFHRVEDWVVQGGDPEGTGMGGKSMPTELNKKAFVEGSLGVARGGDIKVSNDSQFFICTVDCDWLTGQYTNFGEVVEGMDVVKAMAIGDKIISLKAVK